MTYETKDWIAAQGTQREVAMLEAKASENLQELQRVVLRGESQDAIAQIAEHYAFWAMEARQAKRDLARKAKQLA